MTANFSCSVGDDKESHTTEISWKVGNWLGTGDCFTVIDTPGGDIFCRGDENFLSKYSLGTSDSQGRDYQHALAMANILKNKVKSVDVFLLLFNGGNSRFQASIIKLLKLYESIFSREMWKNAITEVDLSRCPPFLSMLR